MKTTTCKELASILGCNYVVASGIMSLLVKSGQAKIAAKVFHESGRGKPTRLYYLPSQVTFKIPKTQEKPRYRLVGHRIINKPYKKAV